MIGPKNENPQDLAEYHREIVNNLGYFAMSRTRINLKKSGENANDPDFAYKLESTSSVARIIYWVFFINTSIKAVFLAFLTLGYFGPLEWTDKITNADYLLCVGILVFGNFIWFLRYPLYEIFHSFWKVENSIFASLGYPQDLKAAVNRNFYVTVWVHLAIVWVGCTILVTQFYGDPKYIIWTYSCFEEDNWYLRLIFCLHEFFFMMHPWNNMTGSSSLCAFHGIAFSNVIDGMTGALDELRHSSKWKTVTRNKFSKLNVVQNIGKYTHEKLILDYKKLMLISEQFNSWVSYKIVFLHVCGYSQFVSDVFVAMQVLKLPGMGIMDVWFYIEDSLASMYVIYRVYTFMSHVKPASIRFLRSLNLYLAEVPNNQRKYLWKVFKSLRVVSLKLGPCPVTPMTVLEALEMLANYYVCVALWK